MPENTLPDSNLPNLNQALTHSLTGVAPVSHIAFNKPAFIGTELMEVRKAILENRQISGAGAYTQQCEKFLSDWYGAPTLLVSSCTHALEMAACLLDLKPGDGIILPSFTFVSTANAFLLRGCEIRFADCDEYGQLCLESVKRQLSPNTKAVCVVHYAGNATNMDALSAFCKANNLILVEDAAQAIGATYNGKLLGTFGALGCLSFHETKNLTSGEGGAIIINNPALIERAHFIREKGTNRNQFIQGLTDKYTWVDIGSSYLMSDMNAAYLWVQLQHVQYILEKREQLWNTYRERLTPHLQQLDARILTVPSGNQPNYHLFALIFNESFNNPGRRNKFIAFMRDRSIVTPFHYVPLHDSPMGQKISQKTAAPDSETFENTRAIAAGLVRLPLFYNMTDDEQTRVIESIVEFAESL